MNKNILLLFLSTVTIWGTVWYAIKFQLGTNPVSVSVFYRIALAAFILWMYHRLFLGKFPTLSLKTHGKIALLGAFSFSLNYFFFYFATKYISSGLVSIIFSALIFFNALNNRLFFAKPLQSRVFLGSTIAIIGTGLLFYRPDTISQDESQLLIGAGWALLATYIVSLGNITSAHLSNKGVNVVTSTTLGLMYGAVVSLLALLLQGHSLSISLNVEYVLSLIYLSIFCTALAFILYFNLIKSSGVTQAAVASLLFPLIAIFISWVTGEYQFTLYSFIGVACVFCGSLINLSIGHHYER